MSKKTITMRLKALKPRNPLAFLASARSAGRHGDGNQRQRDQRDLVQRLRDAGAI